MGSHQYSERARVSGNDGVAIGTLVDIDETSEPVSLVVRLDSDGRLVRIPETQVDVGRSSSTEIVATVQGGELTASRAPEEGSGKAAMAADAGADVVSAHTESAEAQAPGEHRTIPVAEEQLRVTKRDAERGRVVIRKRVETFAHDQPVELVHDEVDVERVPVGRDLDEMPSVREEGDTVVVPVVEEVLVVEKRLRLVEEVRITKRQVRERTTVHDDLRREVVDVSAEDTLDEIPER